MSKWKVARWSKVVKIAFIYLKKGISNIELVHIFFLIRVIWYLFT